MKKFICIECDKVFERKTNTVFCSPLCRVEYQNRSKYVRQYLKNKKQ